MKGVVEQIVIDSGQVRGGEARHACQGGVKCARGCMEVHGADSARSTGHTCTALNVADLPVYARLSNHT